MLDDADMARNTQTWKAVMEPFPESAILGWLIGLAIGAALVACVVVALILGYWSRKER